MGGGGGDTNQTSTPWAGAQPYLTQLMEQAGRLYESGQGEQYYPGSTVAPFSPQTQMGLDMNTGRAMGGSAPEQGLSNFLSGSLNQPQVDLAGAFGGANQYLGQIGAGQQALGAAATPMGMEGAQQFAGGATAPWQNVLGGMTQFGGLGEAQQFAGSPQAGALPASQQVAQQAAGGQMAGQQQLGATAAGDYLGANPYLDAAAQRITDKFNEEIAPGIAAQFGGAGRARRGAAGVSGAGIQGDVLGNAAGEVASQLASSVYMPAYEAERGRMLQGATQLGAQQLQGGALGGDLFSQLNQAELGRLGLGSSQYLGERGLAQQAAGMGGDLGLGGGQLASSLYQGGADRQLQAGLGLQMGGMGGIDALSGMYGTQQNAMLGAGGLVPQSSGLDYQNIDRMIQGGAMTEDQAQRLIDAERQRFDFYQQAPWQGLNQFSGIVNAIPSYPSISTSGGGPSRTQGALGGGMSGAAAGSTFGPYGALAGGLLGAGYGYTQGD